MVIVFPCLCKTSGDLIHVSGFLSLSCVLFTGTIETNINKEDLSNPTKRADMSRRVPLGRLGVPEDLAGPAIFLASDMARYSECTG
jgi:NAD(P)-dependent dehydrogenase (short-subunit alcohol dehydrogenase family)